LSHAHSPPDHPLLSLLYLERSPAQRGFPPITQPQLLHCSVPSTFLIALNTTYLSCTGLENFICFIVYFPLLDCKLLNGMEKQGPRSPMYSWLGMVPWAGHITSSVIEHFP
jgi:hypothetical protein